MKLWNVIKNKSKFSVLFLVMTVLVGCAPVYDRIGPQVKLVPVEYQLDLVVANEQIFWQELNRFIEHHQQLILTQPIVLSTANSQGMQFAKQVQAKLLALGVTRGQISQQLQQPLEGDFQIRVKQYIAKTEACPYQVISPFYNTIYGCNVEHNRWISMVHPEDGVVKN